MWPATDRDLYTPFIGKFNGVVYQVCDDLAESPKVSDEPARTPGWNLTAA